MFEQTHAILQKIKNQKPLILNITNYVTMDFIANGLLALGASPLMSEAEEEIEDLIKMAKALVINPGTLNDTFISLCKKACAAANQLKIPIVFDPVGAGASLYRTHFYQSLIREFHIAIIRGNASEIMALAGLAQQTKGVDTTSGSFAALESAKRLAKQCGAMIVISGETDILVDDDCVTQLNRGSSMMPGIIGTGCLLTSVIAAFHAVEHKRLAAAASAALFYSLCGETAAMKSQGPGSFKTHFLDALSFLPERGQYETC